MSEDQQNRLKIENLIYRLNHTADKRQLVFDRLWELEKQAKDMRLDLIRLLKKQENLNK